MFKQKQFTKIALIAIVVVSFFGAASSAVQAPANEGSLLFGQKQSYTAIVRADQKVVTYAKIVFSNQNDQDLKETSFALPDGVTASNLSAYQIIPPQKCVQAGSAGKCLKYESEDYDFSQNNYYYGAYPDYSYSQPSRLTYKKIDLQKSGSSYKLALPEPVKNQKQGAYLVSFVGNGFTKGSLGLYKLEFKTLKVPQAIEEVNVAVDVDSDLYTKEKKSKIDYANTSELLASAGASDAKSIKSDSLDRLQSNIGSGGTFTKTGKSLAPNEVFVVNGEFADAAWKLNLGWIAVGIIGFIVLLGAVILLLKKASQEEVIYNEKGQTSGKK